MTITTTLAWRGNELMAGRIPVGQVDHEPEIPGEDSWMAYLLFECDNEVFHPTEPAARAALEAKAKEALSNG